MRQSCRLACELSGWGRLRADAWLGVPAESAGGVAAFAGLVLPFPTGFASACGLSLWHRGLGVGLAACRSSSVWTCIGCVVPLVLSDTHKTGCPLIVGVTAVGLRVNGGEGLSMTGVLPQVWLVTTFGLSCEEWLWCGGADNRTGKKTVVVRSAQPH